jgi:predicted nucleic-acid-binding protein
MSGYLDTSLLVRYLTDDPPEMAERAAGLIDDLPELRVTETALIETAYVLRRTYGLAREEVVDLLISLLQKENIQVPSLDKAIAITALLLCRPSGRVSFGDALIWAAARSTGPPEVYSFDQRFPSDGIVLHRP